MWSLVLVAVFSAVVAMLLVARLGSGPPNTIERFLLDELAAVFIEMVLFRPSTATIIGTFCSTLFISAINNGFNLIEIDTFIQNIF